MSWHVEGTYFENCNCDFACPCTVTPGEPATGDRCTFLVAFNIQRGEIEGVDVGGRAVAWLAETPKKMGDGNWRVGWIIDDQASKEQFDNLSALFTGKLGGPMADLVPAFGAILGIEQQPIEYGDDGLRHHANIGDGIAVEIQDFIVEGMPEPVRVSGLPHPVNSTLTIAKPTSSRIRAFGLEFHNDGKSAFSAPFRWSG